MTGLDDSDGARLDTCGAGQTLSCGVNVQTNITGDTRGGILTGFTAVGAFLTEVSVRVKIKLVDTVRAVL